MHEWFLENMFLGSQWSIILGYRRLSVKSRNEAPNKEIKDHHEDKEIKF